MKASIVILNWNGGAKMCLESVGSAINQDYLDKEILFVDNASNDGSPEIVKSTYPGIIFIQTGRNIGCPAGRNIGALAAKGEIVFFLDNDGVWLTVDVVSGVMNCFAKFPQMGALFTRVVGYESNKPDLAPNGIASDMGLFMSDTFRGGASAIRRQLFIDMGCFPNDFIRQKEEAYISLKIYNAGYFVAYWPERTMRHKGSDYQDKSKDVFCYNFENSMKTILRIYPLFLAVTIGLFKYLYYASLFCNRKYFTEFINISNNLLYTINHSTGEKRISIRVINFIEYLRSGKLKCNLIQYQYDMSTFQYTTRKYIYFLEPLKRAVCKISKKERKLPLKMK